MENVSSMRLEGSNHTHELRNIIRYDSVCTHFSEHTHDLLLMSQYSLLHKAFPTKNKSNLVVGHLRWLVPG